MSRRMGMVMVAAAVAFPWGQVTAREIVVGGGHDLPTLHFDIPNIRSRPPSSSSPASNAAPRSPPSASTGPSANSTAPVNSPAPARSQQPQRDFNHEAAVMWVNQGDLFFAQGRYEDADDAYTKALGLEPGNGEVQQKRDQERDARIAKADTTIQPIKQQQIAGRLQRLGEPAGLARAEAGLARTGGEASGGGNGSGGTSSQALGRLHAMLGGTSPGFCWDSGCASTAVAIPRIVATFDHNPIVPPSVRMSPQGPAIAVAEHHRDQARNDQGNATAKQAALQQPEAEPDPVERDQAITRAVDQGAKATVQVMEDNHDVDESLFGRGAQAAPTPAQ